MQSPGSSCWGWGSSPRGATLRADSGAEEGEVSHLARMMMRGLERSVSPAAEAALTHPTLNTRSRSGSFPAYSEVSTAQGSSGRLEALERQVQLLSQAAGGIDPPTPVRPEAQIVELLEEVRTLRQQLAGPASVQSSVPPPPSSARSFPASSLREAQPSWVTTPATPIPPRPLTPRKEVRLVTPGEVPLAPLDMQYMSCVEFGGLSLCQVGQQRRPIAQDVVMRVANGKVSFLDGEHRGLICETFVSHVLDAEMRGGACVVQVVNGPAVEVGAGAEKTAAITRVLSSYVSADKNYLSPSGTPAMSRGSSPPAPPSTSPRMSSTRHMDSFTSDLQLPSATPIGKDITSPLSFSSPAAAPFQHPVVAPTTAFRSGGAPVQIAAAAPFMNASVLSSASKAESSAASLRSLSKGSSYKSEVFSQYEAEVEKSRLREQQRQREREAERERFKTRERERREQREQELEREQEIERQRQHEKVRDDQQRRERERAREERAKEKMEMADQKIHEIELEKQEHLNNIKQKELEMGQLALNAKQREAERQLLDEVQVSRDRMEREQREQRLSEEGINEQRHRADRDRLAALVMRRQHVADEAARRSDERRKHRQTEQEREREAFELEQKTSAARLKAETETRLKQRAKVQAAQAQEQNDRLEEKSRLLAARVAERERELLAKERNLQVCILAS